MKDRVRLPPRYHAAGVGEYWIVDARQPEVRFTLQRRGPTDWEEIAPDAGGFRRSPLLALGLKLVRIPMPSGLVRWAFETDEAGAR